jgi:hypothetical protein
VSEATVFAYVDANPLAMYDSLGLSPASTGAAWGAAIGGTVGVAVAAGATYFTAGANTPFIAPEV